MDVLADYARAVALGVVQGLTEFLPVSSSGHLLLAPELIGDEASSLTFDVGLHIGTMFAVIVYFARDWGEIIGSGLRDVAVHRHRVGRWSPRGRLGLWIVAGTVPAVVAGLLFDGLIERELREPVVVGVMLIVFAGVISVLDRWGGTVGRMLDMTLGRAITVGVAQAIALVPGVSRSGVTIAAARGLGFERPAAARFSFLLSAPVVLGAGVLRMAEAVRDDEVVVWGPLAAGAVVAFVLGMFVIRGLLAYLESHTLRLFVWYRIALGLAVLTAVAAGAL